MKPLKWGTWCSALENESYLFFVGCVAATSINHRYLPATICAIFFVLYFVRMQPLRKKTFSRRDELKQRQQETGLKEEEIDELRSLNDSMTGNATIAYYICGFSSFGLLLYNIRMAIG